MAVDRNEVVWRTDLAELCDQLLGPRKGRGISGTWPCPAVGHGPQTGRTPPVGVFRTHHGEQRWRCHGCGSGGSAIDLVMQSQGIGFSQALEVLGRQAGVPDSPSPRPSSRSTVQAATHEHRAEPSPEIERYVAACEAWLWSPAGRVQRDWLHRRGLFDEGLKTNRFGADPGPRRMARPAGLPRGGIAVVLPVLDERRSAVYCQARYLSPHSRRFDNPTTALAGVSPRLAELRFPGPASRADVVVVCEGMFDALSTAQARLRSVAVLGAAAPDRALASTLTTRFPVERFVVAFDGDDAGRTGGRRLGRLLLDAGAEGRVAVLDVPTDLNDWLVASGPAFVSELTKAVERSVARSLGDLALAQPERALSPLAHPPLIAAPPRGRGLDISW